MHTVAPESSFTLRPLNSGSSAFQPSLRSVNSADTCADDAMAAWLAARLLPGDRGARERVVEVGDDEVVGAAQVDARQEARHMRIHNHQARARARQLLQRSADARTAAAAPA